MHVLITYSNAYSNMDVSCPSPDNAPMVDVLRAYHAALIHGATLLAWNSRDSRSEGDFASALFSVPNKAVARAVYKHFNGSLVGIAQAMVDEKTVIDNYAELL
jgi:hypothetical protein